MMPLSESLLSFHVAEILSTQKAEMLKRQKAKLHDYVRPLIIVAFFWRANNYFSDLI